MTAVQTKTIIRSPYEPSMPVRKSFSNATMAKQSFQDECDINNIMRKYQSTGLIDHTQKIQGSYGDFTSVEDYHTSINRVMAADAAFGALPAQVRRRFQNDPAEFLGFVDDPDNYQEAVELGLLPQEPSSMPAVPASPAEEPSGDDNKKVSPKGDPPKKAAPAAPEAE